VQSLLNALLVKGVCHNSGLNVLPGSEVKKLAKAVARADQRALNANTLEGERGKGNGSGLQSGSKL
jgi:Holliday junction resolvasome RuvABC DNA-binding subunit